MFTPAAGLGALLVGVGIAVTLAGVALYNMDFGVPNMEDRTTPKQDPSLRGGSNQARPYGSIPVVFGRHLLSPDYAAKPYTYVVVSQKVKGSSERKFIRMIFDSKGNFVELLAQPLDEKDVQ